jgi:hypothetical protein
MCKDEPVGLPARTGSSIFEAAKKYHSIGYRIIPVNAYKEPYLPKHGTWKRDFDINEFRDAPCIGIRLGVEIAELGYPMCIDLDTDNRGIFDRVCDLLQLNGISPGTVTVKTGGGKNGWHIYYVSESPLESNINFRISDIFEEAPADRRLIEFSVNSRYTVIPPSVIEKPYQCLYQSEFNLAKCERINPQQYKSLIRALRDRANNSRNPVSRVVSRNKRRTDNSISELSIPPYSRVVSIDLEDVFHPSKDFSLWISLLTRIYKATYGNSEFNLRWDAECGKSSKFLCPLHPEKAPSAALYRGQRGHIVYMDFHARDGKKYYQIEEVYLIYLIKIGKASAGPICYERAWKYILELVREFEHWTPEAKRVKKFYGEIRQEVSAIINYILPNSDAGKFMTILDTVMDTGILEARIGRSFFIASTRFIANKTGIKPYTVNRSINLVCCLGLIKKIGKKSLSFGATDLLTIDENITPSELKNRCLSLKKAGMKSLRTFTTQIESLAFGFSNRRRKADPVRKNGKEAGIEVVQRSFQDKTINKNPQKQAGQVQQISLTGQCFVNSETAKIKG